MNYNFGNIYSYPNNIEFIIPVVEANDGDIICFSMFFSDDFVDDFVGGVSITFKRFKPFNGWRTIIKADLNAFNNRLNRRKMRKIIKALFGLEYEI